MIAQAVIVFENSLIYELSLEENQYEIVVTNKKN